MKKTKLTFWTKMILFMESLFNPNSIIIDFEDDEIFAMKRGKWLRKGGSK